jgi:hypothetical protein
LHLWMNDTSSPELGLSTDSSSSAISFALNFDEPGNISITLAGALETEVHALNQMIVFDSLASGTTYSYLMTYCDNLGNCGVLEGTETTDSVASGGGGGGGGGGGSSSVGTSSAAIIEAVMPLQEIQTFGSEGHSAFRIDFLSLPGVRIFVHEVLAPPIPLGSPEEKVYKYMEINKTGNISNANITFSVDRSWLGDRDPSHINLYRFSGSWEKLPTRKVLEGPEEIVYISETTGFSFFGIAYDGPIPELPAELVIVNDDSPLPEQKQKKNVLPLVSALVVLALISLLSWFLLRRRL